MEKKKRGGQVKPVTASKQLLVRVTPEQKAAYQRAAEAADVTVSEWLKGLADKAAK